MLILTRKYGESIVINDNIVITYRGINHKGEATIGFEAPPETSIWRKEIHDKIKVQELEEI